MTEVDNLTLLPRPRQIAPGHGAFVLLVTTPIQIPPQPSEATVQTARGLQNALFTQFGITLPIVPTAHPGSGAINLVLGENDGASPADLGPEAYTISISGQHATVAANDEAGLFYGVQTLIQIAKSAGRRLPGLEIRDQPVLPVRGLMLDISRRKVPTLATLTELVRTLAHYKYNQFQLYTEHTFAFPRHPEIGANAGSLTSDDILALDAVCCEHHVELVPNLQSLGHQRDLLNLPRYQHLAETPWNWTLAVSQEGTYELLDELYDDLLPAFSSNWLNVDADEPYDVGRGQSKAMTDEIGPGRVYLRHIQRLHQLAAKHGKQMMMWADMFWHYPDLIGEMPEDILFLDWWYEPKERYATVDAIAKAGRRFYVCPGTSSWSSFFPRLDNAIHNIRTFVHDGVEAGAEGMLLTDWGDGGHYQPLSNSWYPYLWGAECAWTGSGTTTEQFDAAFSRLFIGDASGQVVTAMHRLGATMKNAPVWITTWNTPMALWEDPLAGDLAEVVPAGVVAETRIAAEGIFPILDLIRDPGIRADLGLSAGVIHFATNKVDTTRHIHQTLAAVSSGKQTAEQGNAQLTKLVDALRLQRRIIPALVAEFEQRWLAHARRSEIQVNLDRFAALLARYDVAIPWLETQRDACAAGQPVDADLATYDRGDYAVLWQESKQNIENLVNVIGEQALPPDIQLSLARLRERTAGVVSTSTGFR
jgi:hypothetical protein